MKALIVSSGDYEQLANTALHRAGKYLGIQHGALLTPQGNPFRSKLESLLQWTGAAYLIDADWWAMQDAALPEPKGDVVYAPPSLGIDRHFTGTSVPKGGVFCSCFIGLDMSSERIKTAVKRALQLLDEAPAAEQVFDEKFLNIAFYDDPKITVSLLSTNWNWCDNSLHSRVIGCHAALKRTPEEKLKFLEDAKFVD